MIMHTKTENPTKHHTTVLYTPKMAVADDILVDATKMARKAGFVPRVFVTRTVWDRYIIPTRPSRVPMRTIQQRFLNIMFALAACYKRNSRPKTTMFKVAVDNAPVQLKAVLEGDTPWIDPIVTILMPYED